MPTNNATNTSNPITVPQGGTGDASLTAYSILCGGTTSTGAIQSVASVGTTGQILTSNGAGFLPTFQTSAGGGISTVDGTSGSITGSTVTITGQDGITTSGSGATMTITPRASGTDNMFLGQGAGASAVSTNRCVAYGAGSGANWDSDSDEVAIGVNSQNNISNGGSQNVSVGSGSLAGANVGAGAYSPSNIVAIGFQAQYMGTSGSDNVAIGYQSMRADTFGQFNTCVGSGTGIQLTGGNYNTLISAIAGENYSGTESNNIIIGNAGIIGDNNIIRIGSFGNSASSTPNTACFVDGISGVTVTGTAVLVSASGQLGIAISSERYKENIRDLGDTSKAIFDLRPVSFTYKADEKKEVRHGLIAEEVEKTFPYLVAYNKEGIPESVQYHELAVLLLNEVQKLKKEVEQLKKKVS